MSNLGPKVKVGSGYYWLGEYSIQRTHDKMWIVYLREASPTIKKIRQFTTLRDSLN